MGEFPLGDLDERALGAQVPWFREGLTESTRDSDYWTVRDYSTSVGEVRAPVQFVGGWYRHPAPVAIRN